MDYGGLSAVPNFDESLPINWHKERERKRLEILGADPEANKKALLNFWAWYREYLDSHEWKEKRTRVLLRANNICEGCGEKKAMEAHHLSYKHRGAEFLFELVALCQECHAKLHAEHENKSIEELNKL